jgi:hypothetical protein
MTMLNPIQAVQGRLLVGSWAASSIILHSEQELCAILILVGAKTAAIELREAKDRGEAVNASDSSKALSPILHVAGYYPKQHPTEFLTQTLPSSMKFIQSHLATSPRSRVAILCEDAKDLSVGITTAALALYFDDAGEFAANVPGGRSPVVTKDSVKRRLQWVLSSCPGANPARATLRRINEYLMSPGRPSLQGPVL